VSVDPVLSSGGASDLFGCDHDGKRNVERLEVFLAAAGAVLSLCHCSKTDPQILLKSRLRLPIRVLFVTIAAGF